MSYRIIKLLSDVDCVVLADYSKGFYTEYLAQSIIANAKDNGKMVFVDPKPANIRYFTGCSVVRPNLKEAVEITGIKCKNEDTDLERIVKKLGDIVRSPYSLVSWKGGVIVYDSPSAMCKKIMTKTRDVVDVTGAGDTMIAALSLGMVSGLDINGAAELANHAAGIVVGKAGTATTTVDEVRIAIGKNGY